MDTWGRVHCAVVGCVLVLAALAGCATTEPTPGPEDRFAGDAVHPVLHIPFDSSARAFGPKALQASATSRLSYAPGLIGQAVVLDGSGQSVRWSGTSRLQISDAITMELWVNMPEWKNPDKTSAHIETAIALGTIAHLNVSFDDWSVSGGVMNDSSEIAFAVGGAIEPDGWHHLALTFGNATGVLSLFVDGQKATDQKVTGKLWSGGSFPDLVVGTWYETNQAFRGMVDEVRIYNSVLDPETIRGHAVAP